MRRLAGMLALALALAGVVAWVSPAHAMCAAPTLTVTPSAVVAGQSVTLHGRYFSSTCHDTGQGGPDVPSKNIALSFVQGSRSVPLGHVNADSHLAFVTVVRIPTDARAGAASVRADQSEAPVTVSPRAKELPHTGGGTSWFGALVLLIALAAWRLRSVAAAGG